MTGWEDDRREVAQMIKTVAERRRPSAGRIDAAGAESCSSVARVIPTEPWVGKVVGRSGAV